ncbi:MAG: Ni/Fe-hydrogenase cytochrome b subunit [Myxococcales bacterium]|nr:Ni/Fe-hydrogenase cytochrome b subunit [Myxococcales bacterium]
MSTHAPAAPVGGKLVTPVTLSLLVMVIAMLAVLGVRFVYGLGATTNMNQGYPWGLWIAWDVVTGSALAGGGFATALLVYILNRGEYHPLIRPALVAALLGYLQAGFSVMFDLGRWWDFWHIFWPGYAQVNSVLFEVAICISAYILIMMLELMPVVLEKLGWENARKKVNRLLFIFVAVGVLLPMMHQSSLGTLLVVFGPQVHPLYQSNLLPILFLSSTIGMGYAAVTIEGAISSVGLHRPFEKEILAKLLQVGRVLMVLYLVVRFGDLVWRGALGLAFEASLPALMFWIENFLFSAPLWLLATKEHRLQARRIFLGAMAMALGGIVYRLSAFLVAYQTGAGWSYFPSLGELTVTVGLIAFEVLAIIVAIRLLPILPAHQPGMRSTTP